MKPNLAICPKCQKIIDGEMEGMIFLWRCKNCGLEVTALERSLILD